MPPESTGARLGRAAGALFRPRHRAAGTDRTAAPSLAATVGSNLGRAAGILVQPGGASAASATGSSPSAAVPASAALPASAGASSAASRTALPPGSVARGLGRAVGVFVRTTTGQANAGAASGPPPEGDGAAREAAPGARSAHSGAGPVGYGRALARSSRHFLGSLKHVVHLLGLQIAGVLYLLFAIGFGTEGYHAWSQDHAALADHAASLTQMSTTTEALLTLCLVFAYFGISSLTRARRR